MFKYLKAHGIAYFVFAFVGILAILSEASSTYDEDTHLVELNEENWEAMLEGQWMVEFFAPWCPACKYLAPTWERFAKAAQEVSVNVAKIDVTTSPSLSGRFFVTALPTIYHVNNGEFRQYRGSRDGDALLFFLKHKQWEKLETISAWKKPNTIHMSILSYFFKLSHMLKDYNGRLQAEYGLPTWGSYALFAIGTIFVGAALGLMLVCVVDFLYPPKKTQRQSFSEARNRGVENDDIAHDEIEDDEDVLYDEEDEEDSVGLEEDENQVDEQNVEIDDCSTSDGEKNSNSESEMPESETVFENPTIKTEKNDENTKSDNETKEHKENKENKEDIVNVDSGEHKYEKEIKDVKDIMSAIKEQAELSALSAAATSSDVRKRKPRKAD